MTYQFISTFNLSFSNLPCFSQDPHVEIMNLMNSRDQGAIYEGGQAALNFDVTLPPGVSFPNLTIDFSAPALDDEPLLHFCRINLVHVGSDYKYSSGKYVNYS